MLNITLVVALIFLLFLLPGAIYRRAYHTSVLSNYQSRSSNLSEIIITLGVGTALQLFFVYLTNASGIGHINIGKIGDLLIKPDRELFTDISSHLFQILLYNISVYSLSYLLGRVLLRFVLKQGLDLKFQSLKFDNDWHYLFSRNLTKEKPHFVVISALTKIDKGYYLYSGILLDYSRASNGDINYIELIGARKKIVLNDGSKVKSNPTHIEDDKLILPYREILNLSVRYITLDIEPVVVSNTRVRQ
jgi:hypothetical protein